MPNETINLNFPIDKDLWLRLKNAAAERRESLRYFAAKLLREGMDKPPKKQRASG
jgi:hypothetical protein